MQMTTFSECIKLLCVGTAVCVSDTDESFIYNTAVSYHYFNTS